MALEPILPDGKVGGFGREAVPLLKQNQYGPALLLMTQRVAGVIAADAGVQLENVPKAQSAPDNADNLSNLLAILVPAFVILFIVGFVVRGVIRSLRGGGPGSGGSGGSGLSNLLMLMLLSNRGGGSWGGGGGGGSWGGGGGFGGGGGLADLVEAVLEAAAQAVAGNRSARINLWKQKNISRTL